MNEIEVWLRRTCISAVKVAKNILISFLSFLFLKRTSVTTLRRGLTSKEIFDIVPCSWSDSDIFIPGSLIFAALPFLGCSHDTQRLLVGGATDEELDSLEYTSHVEHLKITVTYAEDYLDLGAHHFLNFALRIESTLGSLP